MAVRHAMQIFLYGDIACAEPGEVYLKLREFVNCSRNLETLVEPASTTRSKIVPSLLLVLVDEIRDIHSNALLH